MGRAMLIICAGLLISLGFVALGTSEQGQRLTQNNSGYAVFVQAKNRAHTAIQMAFQEMNKDPDWAKNHGKGNPWYPKIGGQKVELYVDYFYDNPAFFGIDSLRIFSSTVYGDNLSDSAKVISVYTRNEIDLVPTFESALTLASDFTTITTDGSANIDGTNSAGHPGCTDKPGIVANNAETYADAQTGTQKLQDKNAIKGDPHIAMDTGISYDPTDDLIERLKELGDVQKVTGNYKGSFGTKDNPGVFFVEGEAKLSGGLDDGYGILVIQNEAQLSLDSLDASGNEVSLAGNFVFNGLVIFENAYNLNGRGTPTINGTVLIGNTDDYSGKNLDIDLSGNVQINYDCTGEDYANQAAAMAFKQGRYRRIVTFE